MKKILLKAGMLFLGFLLQHADYAQSLQHPVIWGTIDDRSTLLEKIENYDWAKSAVDDLHDLVDGQLAVYQTNPNAILNTIPAFSPDDTYSESEASPFTRGYNKLSARKMRCILLVFPR